MKGIRLTALFQILLEHDNSTICNTTRWLSNIQYKRKKIETLTQD